MKKLIALARNRLVGSSVTGLYRPNENVNEVLTPLVDQSDRCLARSIVYEPTVFKHSEGAIVDERQSPNSCVSIAMNAMRANAETWQRKDLPEGLS